VAGSRRLADLVAHLGILERVDKGDVPAEISPRLRPAEALCFPVLTQPSLLPGSHEAVIPSLPATG
jgi:hypothetical protein